MPQSTSKGIISNLAFALAFMSLKRACAGLSFHLSIKIYLQVGTNYCTNFTSGTFSFWRHSLVSRWKSSKQIQNSAYCRLDAQHHLSYDLQPEYTWLLCESSQSGSPGNQSSCEYHTPYGVRARDHWCSLHYKSCLCGQCWCISHSSGEIGWNTGAMKGANMGALQHTLVIYHTSRSFKPIVHCLCHDYSLRSRLWHEIEASTSIDRIYMVIYKKSSNFFEISFSFPLEWSLR